jgi:hypothetical protein
VGIQQIDLLDATGRVAGSWSGKQPLTTGLLDVSGLASGHYVLMARSVSWLATVPVLIR